MGLKIKPRALKLIRKAQIAVAAWHSIHWKEVRRGKQVAIIIALENGTVTSRQVITYMMAEGSWVAGDDTEYWVSAIFTDDVWEWTGDWTTRDKKSVKTQGGWRPNKIWRLKNHGLHLFQ